MGLPRFRPQSVAPTKIARYKGTAALWAESGKAIRVKSSNVHSIRYDADGKKLYVTFLARDRKSAGAEYEYEGVPARVAKNMFHAGSMGRFVHAFLKGRYSYRVV